jgi:hypothetical protein
MPITAVSGLSAWKVSQYLFPHREEAPASRELFGSIADVVLSFDGEFVAGGPDDTRKKVTLMVAAMSQASFGERLRSSHAEEVILFVGDREKIQLDAIDARVLAVVITVSRPLDDPGCDRGSYFSGGFDCSFVRPFPLQAGAYIYRKDVVRGHVEIYPGN